MKYRLNIVFRKGLKIRLVLLMFIFQFVISSLTVAQDPINIKDMSRADIMNLTYEQLLEMQMEDLLYLAQKMDISVDDLLTMKLSVSSKNSTSLREQPGIITIYTSEDLDKLGLRSPETGTGIQYQFRFPGSIGSFYARYLEFRRQDAFPG
jgi:hypothetical protein